MSGMSKTFFGGIEMAMTQKICIFDPMQNWVDLDFITEEMLRNNNIRIFLLNRGRFTEQMNIH